MKKLSADASETPDEDAPKLNSNELEDDSEADVLFSKLRLRIPGYRLLRSIGGGGQGTVYKAVRESDGLVVAIKMLHMGAFATDEARSRMKREVTALKVLKDPGIVRIVESGQTDDGTDYLVTEFVDGRPLDRFTDDGLTSLGIRERLLLFVRICQAVGIAHRKGITHRDLSPANILVNKHGQPIIVDFGLARSAFDAVMAPGQSVTSEGYFLGRIDYASPEQFRMGSADISQPSDVYSLGVILHGLIGAWKHPFESSEDRIEFAKRILSDEPSPPEIQDPRIGQVHKEALAVIVKKALQKKPEDRFQNASELSKAIQEIAVSIPDFDSILMAEPQSPSHVARVATDTPKARKVSDPGPEDRRMDMTGSRRRERLISWASEVCDIIEKRGDANGAGQIRQAMDQLRRDRFSLAILGKAKRGKSTLINALLGRRDDLVAPIDRLPASSAITRLGWNEVESAEVFFQDGRTQQIGYSQIREFVTEERNPENRKRVGTVRVSGPFPMLDKDLELVDTPGAGSIHEHHDAILLGFIPEADAVVFLISARMPIDAEELDLLRKLKYSDVSKIFFVLNRTDECTSEEVAEAEEHNKRLLSDAGIECEVIHRISGKRAYMGDWYGSGIEPLVHEIRKFIARQRGAAMTQRFVARVSNIAMPTVSGIQSAMDLATRSTEQIREDIESLRKEKIDIEDDRKYCERKFKRVWNVAIEQLTRGVRSAKSDVEATLLDEIRNCSLVSLDRLVHEMPYLLSKAVEDGVSNHFTRFEETARRECEKLSAEYPVLSVGVMAPHAIRKPRRESLSGSYVGGAAAVLAGMGVASLGAALPTTGLFVTVAPFLAVASGPVGWTVAGIGMLAIPFSWRVATVRQKDRLEFEVRRQLRNMFQQIEEERIPLLAGLAESIAEDFEIELEREMDQVARALEEALQKRPDTAKQIALESQANRLKLLLSSVQEFLTESPSLR